MGTHTLTLACILGSGILLLIPASGLAQRPQPPSTRHDSQSLRGELDRVNAEIAGLKSANRSVRNDYLLRDKLAEAEALARKLTEAESRERRDHTSAQGQLSGTALIPPVATPHDSAVELEAKADLMSDQARRFLREADTLDRTAREIRARQNLRRRAWAWDRDPLAGFETSKRNLAVTGRSAVVTGDSSASPTRGTTTQGSNGSSAKGAASEAAAPTFGGGGLVGGPGSSIPISAPASAPSAPAATASGPGASTESSGPAVTAPAPSQPISAPTAVASDSSSRAALQQRPLLDPTALASIRSNLDQMGSTSDPNVLEAAAVALRRHAQALEERARRLRSGLAPE